jgi:hypothetical protein
LVRERGRHLEAISTPSATREDDGRALEPLRWNAQLEEPPPAAVKVVKESPAESTRAAGSFSEECIGTRLKREKAASAGGLSL